MLRILRKKTILGSLASLGFLLGVTSGTALAQIPHEMSPNSSGEASAQFRSIEQPLGLKVGVTVGGIALIGLEDVSKAVDQVKKAPTA